MVSVNSSVVFDLLNAQACSIYTLHTAHAHAHALRMHCSHTLTVCTPHHHYAQASWRSLPLQLARTTAGARMECDDADCRLANTLTAAADCMLTLVLMLLLPRKLRRHVEAVSRRVDHARVTLADYSVELHGLPEDVTQDEVREIVSCTLQQHAEARLQRLQQKEASVISRCTEKRHAFRPPSLQRAATRELKLEAELLGGAVERARRFLTEERWRVHEDGVTLCLRNGRLLSRARRKVPLLRRIEVLQKHDERLKALRRGPPSLLERLGDWRRARRLRREQDRLEATSAGLLHEVYNGTDAQRAVSAIVTFEEEEGKLEALHAFPPLGFGSCTTGAPVAREAPEPSDRFLHNLEYRGSWGNMARALFSYAALVVVVGASFGLLFASQNIDTLLTVNSTSFACDGLKQIVAAGGVSVGVGGNGGGGGGAPPDALSGEEAGSGGATEEAGSGGGGGGAYFFCLDLSTQVHLASTSRNAHTMHHAPLLYTPTSRRRRPSPSCRSSSRPPSTTCSTSSSMCLPSCNPTCTHAATQSSIRSDCCSPIHMYRRCSPGYSGLAPSVASHTPRRVTSSSSSSSTPASPRCSSHSSHSAHNSSRRRARSPPPATTRQYRRTTSSSTRRGMSSPRAGCCSPSLRSRSPRAAGPL